MVVISINNNQNFTREQLTAFAEKFSKGSSLDAKALSEALKANDLDSFVKNNLSKEQSEKLNRVLSDENAVKNLLSSPQAQKLMKKLTGE